MCTCKHPIPNNRSLCFLIFIAVKNVKSLTCGRFFFLMEINEVNGCGWRRINWIRCMWFWSGSWRRATSNTSSLHCNTWISPFIIHYAQTQWKNRPYNRFFDSIIKKKWDCCFSAATHLSPSLLHQMFLVLGCMKFLHQSTFLTIKITFWSWVFVLTSCSSW